MRKVVFWCHLSLGVTAGAVILVMASTGVLLSLEGPVTAWAESGLPRPADSDAPRLSLASLAEKAGGKPTSISVSSDPKKPVVLGFGRGKTVSLDPRTGKVLPSGSRARRFFHEVEDIHRWLGSRAVGRPVTGAANAAFLLLALGGPVLWWPRARKAAITAPDLGLKGKARDFNWHNAVGIWCAPVLLVITSCGVLMSYEGATALLYKTLGEGVPVAAPAVPSAHGPVGLDAAFAAGTALVPDWSSVMIRLPGRDDDSVSVGVTEPSAYPPYPRSQLKLDAATGDVLKWEPQSAAGRGRRWRALARFLHTGEALGVPGRLLAGLASAGGVLLVWTGLALAWRRWRKTGA